MNVKLGEKFERFVQRKVRSGEYLSSAEVIRDALRLLQEKDQLRELRVNNLRQEIEEGVRDLDAGRFTTYTEETLPHLLDKIQRAGKARLANRSRKAG